MVIFESVLVDTDILIKAFRGDKIKQTNLKYLKDKYCISVITACELLNGAKNINQRQEFNKALRYYTKLIRCRRLSSARNIRDGFFII